MQTLQTYYQQILKAQSLYTFEPSRYDDDRSDYTDNVIAKKVELLEWKLDQLDQQEYAQDEYQAEDEYIANMKQFVSDGYMTQAQADDLIAYHRTHTF